MTIDFWHFISQVTKLIDANKCFTKTKLSYFISIN